MSHQFSILQPSVGFNSARSKLLTTYNEVVMLKKLQLALSIKDCQQIEIVLLAIIGKFSIQVSRIFCFLQQISLCWNGLRHLFLFNEWCHPPADTFNKLKKQYIHRWKKFMVLPVKNGRHSNIFDTYLSL